MTKNNHTCPHCKAACVYSTANTFRPFCSERCKLIDLGEWASESYRIPEKPQEGYANNDLIPPEDETHL